MNNYLSLLKGFLIDFLFLVLLFDFCNVDFIVDGPNRRGKREIETEKGKKEVVRNIERKLQTKR